MLVCCLKVNSCRDALNIFVIIGRIGFQTVLDGCFLMEGLLNKHVLFIYTLKEIKAKEFWFFFFFFFFFLSFLFIYKTFCKTVYIESTFPPSEIRNILYVKSKDLFAWEANLISHVKRNSRQRLTYFLLYSTEVTFLSKLRW